MKDTVKSLANTVKCADIVHIDDSKNDAEVKYACSIHFDSGLEEFYGKFYHLISLCKFDHAHMISLKFLAN